jgi:hypothetical protein
MEAAHRTSLAKGEVGIREKKKAPTFVEFCSQRIEPHAKPRSSWIWYRAGIKHTRGGQIETEHHAGVTRLILRSPGRERVIGELQL